MTPVNTAYSACREALKNLSDKERAAVVSTLLYEDVPWPEGKHFVYKNFWLTFRDDFNLDDEADEDEEG